MVLLVRVQVDPCQLGARTERAVFFAAVTTVVAGMELIRCKVSACGVSVVWVWYTCRRPRINLRRCDVEADVEAINLSLGVRDSDGVAVRAPNLEDFT